MSNNPVTKQSIKNKKRHARRHAKKNNNHDKQHETYIIFLPFDILNIILNLTHYDFFPRFKYIKKIIALKSVCTYFNNIIPNITIYNHSNVLLNFLKNRYTTSLRSRCYFGYSRNLDMFVKHKVLDCCDNYLRNYQKIHKCHRFKYYQDKMSFIYFVLEDIKNIMLSHDFFIPLYDNTKTTIYDICVFEKYIINMINNRINKFNNSILNI